MDSLWSVRRPVGELRPGDHAWLAFGGEDEHRHVVGAFVRTGLAEGDRVVLLGGPQGAEMAGGDQVAVVGLGDSGAVDPRVLARALASEISEADRSGCRAVRIVTDLTWVLRRPGGLELALDCERHIERVIGPSTSAIAICQLDRRACAPGELAALEEAHAVAVTADPDFADSVLRIDRTFHPAGLALGGELDASRHAVFSQALSSVLARADGDPVHLDLAELEFIDLGALSMLAGAATRRPGHGPLVLDRMSARLRSVVEAVGWDMLPGLRLGAPHPGN
ncbi:MEDS domain-containing protein [Thermomonospora echinospora]|nr:MEDS domain-containing protein [Thermomonospora echinospora]